MGFTFDGGIFARKYVELKASGQLKKFFDGLGVEALTILVTQNKDIYDFLPEKEREGLKKIAANAQVQEAIVKKLFTEDDVISWIPDKYRQVISQYPQGKDWATRQIDMLIFTFLPTQ